MATMHNRDRHQARQWHDEHAYNAEHQAAIREEAERVLRARVPYIPAGCDQQGRYAACVGGPCQGGSKLCPSPDACERIADEERNARPLPWYVAQLIGVPPAIVTAVALGIVALLLVLGALHVAMRLAA